MNVFKGITLSSIASIIPMIITGNPWLSIIIYLTTISYTVYVSDKMNELLEEWTLNATCADKKQQHYTAQKKKKTS